jgi:hypothetical protein
MGRAQRSSDFTGFCRSFPFLPFPPSFSSPSSFPIVRWWPAIMVIYPVLGRIWYVLPPFLPSLFPLPPCLLRDEDLPAHQC